MTAGSIPLVDLAWQHQQVAAEVADGFADVISASAFIGGSAVAEFERDYADFLGARNCVGVANGTDAIELTLRALGIGPGDEVVLPANTFVATAEAVVRAGARPVLVDVDDDYLLMDPAAVANALSPRTRAVVPVHLFGQAAPMEQVAKAVEGSDVVLVEDAAQAQGAVRNGVPAGRLAHVAATSFYPGKNLGAYGDAGAVVTDDDEIASIVRALANHGSTTQYVHTRLGFNSRLDALQAVVLRAKLRHLPEWNRLRREAAGRYDELLGGIEGIRRPSALPGNEHVWHLYVVRVPHRDSVLRALHARGVAAGVHYPRPVHLHDAFAELAYGTGSFPVAERAAEEILSLPLFPGITPAQQERVVQELAEAVRDA